MAVLGPRLLGQRDSARYLGVSVRSLFNLEARGLLQAVKLLDRKRLYDVRDLDALVDQVKASQ